MLAQPIVEPLQVALDDRLQVRVDHGGGGTLVLAQLGRNVR